MDWTDEPPRPGRYPPDGKTPAEAMAAIRHASVEVGYGYDADGRLRFIQVGDEESIRGFDQRDLAAIRSGLFVHNHPPFRFPEGDPRRRAGSFSPWDLVFMWERDLTELIAVTAERNYIIRRPGDGYFLDPGEILREYRMALATVREDLERNAANGLVTPEDAMSEGRWADEVMDYLGVFYDYVWTEVVEPWRPT